MSAIAAGQPHLPAPPRLRAAGLSRFGLVLPALLLVVIGLLGPLVGFMFQAIGNPEIPGSLPRTVEVLRSWDGTGLPPPAAYAALAADLRESQANGDIGALARRLNQFVPGYRTLVMKTGGSLEAAPADGDAAATLPRIDRRWGDGEVWRRIKDESGMLTGSYLLAAVDMRRTATGAIEPVPDASRLFLSVFGRTFWVSLVVTVGCLLIGYPAAYYIAQAPASRVPMLMVVVLLPFWTSVLVRTTAWIVLLQNEGLINKSLRAVGLIEAPLPLFANRFAVVLAMVHVLLPYMILPLYAAMKASPPDLMRAAENLGANPVRAFFRVYLPQTYAGVAAGSLLVFILSLGYYVTPQLVGGPADQMIGQFIAVFTNQSLNWGLASALGTILLLAVLLLYAAFARLGSPKVSA